METYTVLVTDDDEMNHEILGEYLEMAGFPALHAYCGVEGLQMLRTHTVDLVLLDIQMPNMDGFQVLEAMQADHRLRDTPVILLSALDRNNLKVKGLELGAMDYVVKPYDKVELLARVRAALRRSSRYRKADNLYAGKLADISLAELVQTMELGQKTAHITLPETFADIFFEKGELAGASCLGFGGKDAVSRALLLERGKFYIDFDYQPTKSHSIGVSAQQALMESVAMIDELLLKLDQVATLDALVEFGDTQDERLKPLKGFSPLPLRELAARLPGNLRENLDYVTDGIKNETIQLKRDT